MARVKRSVNGKKHRRAILEEAQGYTGARSRHFRKANEQVMHSLRYAYRDRRARKGEFRRLWIVRINAACREHEMSYSRFMAGLKAADVDVDRKILADLAVREPAAFAALVETAAGRSTLPELGSHNSEVKRLRALLRDHATRRSEGYFVAEGPRVVAAGLDAVEVVYVGTDASAEARAVADRALGRAIPVRTLAAGVSDRVSDTKHPQGVFALVPLPAPALDELDDASLVLVCEWVSDPGNAGTLIRSAAAAGAGGVVFGRGSVDTYNPKVVRASAGACFAVPIVEDVPIVASLERFDDSQHVGAVADGGVAPEALDLTGRTVLVLGNETHGLSVDTPVDARVTIPMHAGESVNVAMAGTVLMFEAARQRRSQP